jgi:hypothetical protein
MIRRAFVFSLSALALAALAAPASSAAATPRAAWMLDLIPIPANFAPGTERIYQLYATDVGAGATDPGHPVLLEATMPPGLKPTDAVGDSNDKADPTGPECQIVAQQVSCETTEALHPGFWFRVEVVVQVEASEGSLTAQASVEGGGSLQGVATSATTPISTEAVPFDFSSFAAPATDEEGLAATLAGSHPNQLTIDTPFPSVQFDEGETATLTTVGHPRDELAELPRGLSADPAATPVRCTEAQLLGSGGGCPMSSQIGIANVTSSLAGPGTVKVVIAPLYNMVPPSGSPASFGFDAGNGSGIFVHLLSGVRSDSDFGLYGYGNDILALAGHSLLGFQTQLWGDPSAQSHDEARGKCAGLQGGTCPVARQKTPFLTMPGDCPGHPNRFEVRADSWEEPGLFKEATYESADLEGTPVSVAGCNQLSYEPALSVQPSTKLADSPSGLDVDLHQPQEAPREEPLTGRATAELKDARVTLPAGMVVNPSQADGLGACTEEEIGYLAEDEEAGVHFSKQPNSCPDASKLGTMEVASPLLAEYTEGGTKLATDPETGAPIPRPLHGSVYLAKPFDNPFGSLLAIYLAIEDEESGIVAKLGGRIEPDPNTGQLTTVFEENPELPLEDVKLHLPGGARASLTTPIACGTHTTTTTLTPWSSPEGADAHPSDSFAVSGEPGGGACPASEAQAANSPSFEAGTLSPQAGAYSPFVLKLSREDGSQRLTKIDTTLPKGLAARFVGIPYCSDAQIAQAQARSHPDEGAIEKANPSCPAASKVGTVDVAAGAGPTPFHTQGTAYLAGPYKGAPLSLAIITPAIAGPFDLGTVTVRTALYVDPETAQGRAVSDALPTILDGIPLDIRSIAVSLDRPGFTLNPTSCKPMSILGTATSSLGSAASLASPFQVGGCSALKFKPKLSLKLSGGTKRGKNPALRAVLTMPPGGADIAKASVALPHSEFLDQAHIRTVCTRVQFAAGAGNGAECPAGSIYGKARAITPLLDQPLEGPVYLRSSSHPLPDLVAALHGQIDVVLDGRIDTVKGGIRNTFDAVPDAPVSKFVLEMQGGKRGLLENSTNLCRSTNRAMALFDGQNGKVRDLSPVLRNDCKRKKPAKGKSKHRHAHR